MKQIFQAIGSIVAIGPEMGKQNPYVKLVIQDQDEEYIVVKCIGPIKDIAQGLYVGSTVGISWKFQGQRWDKDDGETIYFWAAICETINVLNKTEAPIEEITPTEYEDDLPF